MEHPTDPPSVDFGYQDSYPQRIYNEHSSIRSSFRSSNEVPQAPHQSHQAYQPYRVQTQDLPLPTGHLYYRTPSPVFEPSESFEELPGPSGYIIQQPLFPSKHFSIGQSSFHSGASTPTNDRRRLTGLTGLTPSASTSHLNQDMTWPITPTTMTPISGKGSMIDVTTDKVDYVNRSNESMKENLSEKTAISGPSSPPPGQPGPPGQQAPQWSKTHNVAFIICVCLAQFLSLSGLAQTVAPLLIIGEDLGVQNPGQLSWFTAAYSMSLGAFILPSGLSFLRKLLFIYANL
jgi:hypothetical protein